MYMFLDTHLKGKCNLMVQPYAYGRTFDLVHNHGYFFCYKGISTPDKH